MSKRWKRLRGTKTREVECRAECKSCGGTAVFWRHPRDPHVHAAGHRKHMWCVRCKRFTLHLQLT